MRLSTEISTTNWSPTWTPNFYGTKKNDYRIRLKAKKLKSGKCQVKFNATVCQKEVYGYVLVPANQSLRQVLSAIKSRLDQMVNSDIHHIHLFSIQNLTGNSSINTSHGQDFNFIIFEN